MRTQQRTRRMLALTLTAGLSLGLVSGSAQAGVFSDGFDTGETVGNDPANFTDNSDSSADVSVSNTQSLSSPNSMLLDDDNTSGAAIANTTFTSITSGIVEWEFSYFEANASTGDPELMRARLGNSSQANGLLVITKGDGSGDVLFRQPSTDTVIGNISLNEWNTVRVVGDLATHKADAYFNGSLAASDLDFKNAVSSFDALQFDSSAGLTGDLFIDDATIAIPEPASLAMLGLGALAMLPRRKRNA